MAIGSRRAGFYLFATLLLHSYGCSGGGRGSGDLGSTGAAIDLCEQSEFVLAEGDGTVSIALQRPRTFIIPESLRSDAGRGEVRLRIETSDDQSLSARFVGSGDRLLLRHVVSAGAPSAHVGGDTVKPTNAPVAAGDAIEAVHLEADVSGVESPVSLVLDVRDCEETGSGASPEGAAGVARRNSNATNAGKPASMAGGRGPVAALGTSSGGSGGSSASGTGTGTGTGAAGGTAADTGGSSGGVSGETGDTTGAECPAPDPAQLAPGLDLTVTTSLYEAVRFMFESDPAVQPDVAGGTIVPSRASLVRGLLLGADDLPLSCARVEVVGHPEYGHTSTREDGRYDLVVNGGDSLVLSYSSPGSITAHRRWSPEWNGHAELAPVKLIDVDFEATPIAFTAPIETHIATPVSDADGDRAPVLMFAQGTVATMVMPDASTEELTELTVHVTEFTVGANGPASMPAELPAGTQYTYAVEFTADEVEAAGGTTVLFDPPAVLYVENFLEMPVGMVVPAGSYDRSSTKWEPEPNGVVVSILEIDSGVAVLDVAGEGTPATSPELAALGITGAELEELGTLYPEGTELTRMPVLHFTKPLDCNYSGRPPKGSIRPGEHGPDENSDEDEHCERNGSIIECENQTLGQRVPLPATPFSLNYRSSRVPGAPSRHLRIPLASVPSLPSELLRARLEVSVAGQSFEQAFEELDVGQTHDFAWDGLDGFGRPVQGAQPTRVCVTYDYPATYAGTRDAVSEEQFGDWAEDDVAVQGRSISEVGLSRCYSRRPTAGAANIGAINKANMIRLGGLDARTSSAGLGGWTLSVHHALGMETGTLYLGTGEKRELGDSRQLMLARIAGNGTTSGPLTGDALGAAVVNPQAITVAGDGSVYIATSGRVRRLTIEGQLEAFAGIGTTGFVGDGGAATSARLSSTIEALAFDRERGLYIADRGNNRIRLVDLDGVISTVAGTGAATPLDGGMSNGHGTASSTVFNNLLDLELVDGELWVLSGAATAARLRRISRGSVTHVAGYTRPSWLPGTDLPKAYCGLPNNPTDIFGWDGGTLGDSSAYAEFATKWAVVTYPTAIASHENGLYYAHALGSGGSTRIRDIPRSGAGIRSYRREHTLSAAGGGAYPCGSAGCTWDPESDGLGTGLVDLVAVEGGVVYAAATANNYYLYHAPPSGPISVLAGGGSNALNGEDVIAPAHDVWLKHLEKIAVGSDGAIYAADGTGNKIVKTANSAPGIYGAASIPSADGSEIYDFDDRGRHLQTRDGLTNALLWSFSYDAAGRLEWVVDGDGNITTIVRDGSGQPTAIVSPDGVSTALHVDANGYLDQITYPGGDPWLFENQNNGLMDAMTTPEGHVHAFSYDEQGRLERDDDPASGFQTLGRTSTSASAYEVAHATSLGRTTEYSVGRSATGIRTRSQSFPDGSSQSILESDKGLVTTYAADGSEVNRQAVPDPRLGPLAEVPKRVTVETPLGHTQVVETSVDFTTGPSSSVTRTVVVQEDAARTHRMVYTAADGINLATILTRSAENRATLTELDTQGRATRVQLGTWSGAAFTPSTFEDVYFAYDARGRLETTTHGAGGGARTSTLSYDADGNVDDLTAANADVFDFGYDAAGRLVSLQGPDSEVLALDYDQDGELVGITPPGRPQHATLLDGVGNVLRYTPPDVLVGDDFTEYVYDDDHALTEILRPDGRSVGLAYDSAGRLDTVMLDGGDRVLSYWGTGQLRSFTEAHGGTTELTWDGALLLGVERTVAFEGEVQWTYSDDFLPATETVVGASTVAYAYDHDDLLVTAGDETLTRHPVLGALTGTVLGDVTSTVAYSNFGELSSLAYQYDTTSLYEATYTRDALGRLDTKAETVGGTTVLEAYAYDAAGRLDTVVRDGVLVFDADYDANGNRIALETPGGTRSATHDDQDRLIDDGDFDFVFNAAGELASSTDTVTTDVTTFVYHELGGLLEVDLPGGTEVTYTIDGAGRRIGKEVDGSPVAGWLYGQLLGPVAQLDASGAIEARFVYASRAHVPDYMERAGVTYRLVTDHLGSVRLVVDVATGSIAQRLSYDPWGVVTQDTNPGFQPFGFAGGHYDHDTGLVRFGARDYEPAAGRWTTKDPIGFDGGDSNLYAYVGGDPVNGIDPTGLIFDTVTQGCRNHPIMCTEAGLGAGVGGSGGLQLLRNGQPALSGAPASIATACRSAYVLLSRAQTYGVQSYRTLRTAIRGTGLQAHHLIEQRFRDLFGGLASQMKSIALTPAEHQVFTNAWRHEIAYGDGTREATREQVIAAARIVYAGYPEILKALGL